MKHKYIKEVIEDLCHFCIANIWPSFHPSLPLVAGTYHLLWIPENQKLIFPFFLHLEWGKDINLSKSNPLTVDLKFREKEWQRDKDKALLAAMAAMEGFRKCILHPHQCRCCTISGIKASTSDNSSQGANIGTWFWLLIGCLSSFSVAAIFPTDSSLISLAFLC